MKIFLGVNDEAYTQVMSEIIPGGRRSMSRAQTAYGAGKTTGQIAEILEARYGVMRAFFENTKKTVFIPAIEQSVKGALVTLMTRRSPGKIDIAATGMDMIKHEFRESLTLRKYDQWIGPPLVPTKASQQFRDPSGVITKGAVVHRFKEPYAKRNKTRPSFVDTGAYRRSFNAWMED